MVLAHLHDFYDYSWVILAAVVGFGAGHWIRGRRFDGSDESNRHSETTSS